MLCDHSSRHYPCHPSTGSCQAHAGETREGYYQPLERAELVRVGRDVTILCYSRMRYVVMQAVQQLEKQGYDPEVRATPFFVGCSGSITHRQGSGRGASCMHAPLPSCP